MRGDRQGCAARAVELGENSVVLWRPLQRQCDAPRNFRRRFGRRLGDMQLPIKSRQREGKTADGSSFSGPDECLGAHASSIPFSPSLIGRSTPILAEFASGHLLHQIQKERLHAPQEGLTARPQRSCGLLLRPEEGERQQRGTPSAAPPALSTAGKRLERALTAS